MNYEYQVISLDEHWEIGWKWLIHDSGHKEWLNVYSVLRKSLDNPHKVSFNNPAYGKGSQKPSEGYFEAIKRWPLVDSSEEKWKESDRNDVARTEVQSF